MKSIAHLVWSSLELLSLNAITVPVDFETWGCVYRSRDSHWVDRNETESVKRKKTYFE